MVPRYLIEFDSGIRAGNEIVRSDDPDTWQWQDRLQNKIWFLRDPADGNNEINNRLFGQAIRTMQFAVRESLGKLESVVKNLGELAGGVGASAGAIAGEEPREQERVVCAPGEETQAAEGISDHECCIASEDEDGALTEEVHLGRLLHAEVESKGRRELRLRRRGGEKGKKPVEDSTSCRGGSLLAALLSVEAGRAGMEELFN